MHIGHIRMFEEAKKMGDELVVIVHSDDWLYQKKGFVFMTASERCELIRAFKWVDRVYFTDSLDRSASSALMEIRPDVFANGGDRNEEDSKNPDSSLYKDTQTCKELGITMIFGVGGSKIQSSSKLTYGRN